ncbi:S8 family serine peptidase [Vibrio sp. M60_M31a]
MGDNNDSTADYPSSFDLDNIISVASTNANDDLSSFSNYGSSRVDLGAPGEDIVSTYTIAGDYEIASGTSMAAPHVAGVAVLVASMHPEWGYADIKNRILSTTRPLDIFSRENSHRRYSQRFECGSRARDFTDCANLALCDGGL